MANQAHAIQAAIDWVTREKSLFVDPENSLVTDAPNIEPYPAEVGGTSDGVRHGSGQQFYATMAIKNGPPHRAQVTVAPTWSVYHVGPRRYKIVSE